MLEAQRPRSSHKGVKLLINKNRPQWAKSKRLNDSSKAVQAGCSLAHCFSRCRSSRHPCKSACRTKPNFSRKHSVPTRNNSWTRTKWWAWQQGRLQSSFTGRKACGVLCAASYQVCIRALSTQAATLACCIIQRRSYVQWVYLAINRLTFWRAPLRELSNRYSLIQS